MRYIERLNKDVKAKIYRKVQTTMYTMRYTERLNKDVNNEIYRKAKQRCKQWGI